MRRTNFERRNGFMYSNGSLRDRINKNKHVKNLRNQLLKIKTDEDLDD